MDKDMLISAIKLFREWTSASLAEAKCAVERIFGQQVVRR
jgi:ribosomal protein L7/L12